MPRVRVSIRLKPETIKDLKILGKKLQHKNTSQTLRYLIHIGFSNLGNWRKP
jgi:hypothetical protein